MTPAKKIVLVDDHAILREGLKELIGKLGPYDVLAEYGDGESFVSALPFKDPPDLVILDLGLPGMDGEAVMQALHDAGSNVPVLVLTLNEDEHTIISVFRKGARGYLLKSSGASMLSKALAEIFATGYYHNDFLTMSLKTQPALRQNERDRIIANLSPREKEFLRLVCDEKEYTYQQIAGIMEVQHRTVDGYRESIFEKFGIRSKTGLVLFVLKHRLADYLQA